MSGKRKNTNSKQESKKGMKKGASKQEVTKEEPKQEEIKQDEIKSTVLGVPQAKDENKPTVLGVPQAKEENKPTVLGIPQAKEENKPTVLGTPTVLGVPQAKEENKPTVLGVPSEAKEENKPTVLGTPTVLGIPQAKEENKPTVLDVPSEAKEAPKPTVLGNKKKDTKKKESKKEDVGPEEGEEESGNQKKTKKKGLSKKQLEIIERMRQEEERLKKEEEDRIKREEEEERRRQEEAILEEKRRQEERERRKEREKEKKERQKENAQKAKLEQLRKQYGGILPIEAEKLNTSEGIPPEKKKVVYDTKKKKPKKDELESSSGSSIISSSASPSSSQELINESPKLDESKSSWEDDDWEKLDDEGEKKEDKKNVIANVNNANSNDNANTEVLEEEEKKKQLSGKDLRSPICCILGHVDTGKTKLLDKIRHTNVQEGEAGGITQQIGATFFPLDTIQDMTTSLNQEMKLQYKIPGLLIIDTPGHESFTNLRSRGSSLCDIAILVVDIMHGLEPQTIESINLLKMRKTPFIVALNKIDRLYNWKPIPNGPFQKTLNKQEKNTKAEFEQRAKETITLFAEQGLNASLYYKNQDFRKNVSLVPTSAITGEGIPDLLMLLVQLTQTLMANRLLYSDVLQCTVLEVKVIEGLGTTVDVILVNGILHEGDTIVLCGLNGPIVTTIRALLTPPPLKEIRVKGNYVHLKEIKAAMGVKISGNHLENAIAGGSLLVAKPNDDIELLKKEVMKDLDTMMKKAQTVEKGVYVQASTLGSLEALLEFLKQSKIPVASINIGPVNKKDVMKASIMLEKAPEYAVILAFDVKVVKEAQAFADEMGVKIFTADIIYHLFDAFTAYTEKLTTEKKESAITEAIFPCRLRIYPEHVFNKRDPIVLGVEILEGIVKLGTPIAVKPPGCNWIDLGKITSIQENHKPLNSARKGQSIAIKIEQEINEEKKAFGRHFDHTHELFSHITRKSLDLLKENFKEELEKEDIVLLAKLKQMFAIK